MPVHADLPRKLQELAAHADYTTAQAFVMKHSLEVKKACDAWDFGGAYRWLTDDSYETCTAGLETAALGNFVKCHPTVSRTLSDIGADSTAPWASSEETDLIERITSKSYLDVYVFTRHAAADLLAIMASVNWVCLHKMNDLRKKWVTDKLKVDLSTLPLVLRERIDAAIAGKSTKSAGYVMSVASSACSSAATTAAATASSTPTSKAESALPKLPKRFRKD
jgi:hypothetical protein